jgi:hypothetical protein
VTNPSSASVFRCLRAVFGVVFASSATVSAVTCVYVWAITARTRSDGVVSAFHSASTASLIEQYQSQIRGDQSEGCRSTYYNLAPVLIANTGPFRTYGRNGQSPHPVHGATTSHDNPGRMTKTY